MQIPSYLKTLFEADHGLNSFTISAVGSISSHISSNRMEFFPEYTDHNVTHLESVLNTAVNIISDEALPLLTPEDGAVLTVSVALHDLGMHLTKDGFQTLVSEGNPMKPTKEFYEQNWPSLWRQYFKEATRFDGRKLRQLFGENYRPVRLPPPVNQQWEDFDYLLVGDFLRKHHPRLAHDIATYGMPAKDGSLIKICQSDNDQQKFPC